MKIELKNTKADDADYVFGANIDEIVDAELRSEPALVMQALARFSQAVDFPNKDQVKKDLEDRVTRQLRALSDRDAGQLTESTLSSALTLAVSDGSDALYRLEKRLLDHFPREKVYVRRFFFDASAPRRPKPDPQPPA